MTHTSPRFSIRSLPSTLTWSTAILVPLVDVIVFGRRLTGRKGRVRRRLISVQLQQTQGSCLLVKLYFAPDRRDKVGDGEVSSLPELIEWREGFWWR